MECLRVIKYGDCSSACKKAGVVCSGMPRWRRRELLAFLVVSFLIVGVLAWVGVSLP